MNNYATKEEMETLLKPLVTRDELHKILTDSRSASEKFLDEHDRNFRTIEQNLNAGLSKLSIMSDALANIMRVQSDNYESMRNTSNNHESRIAQLETKQATLHEDYVNLYDSIFGNSLHPDRESIMSVLKGRYKQADAQHEEIMLSNRHVMESLSGYDKRLEHIEEKIALWQKAVSTVVTFLMNTVRGFLKSWAGKTAFGAVMIYITARIADPNLVMQLGEAIKVIFNIK